MQAMQIKMVEVFPMNATLQIPVYQRNYDWRQEQCEKLFSDIENIILGGGAHFLGAIVYKDKKIGGMFNELIIVDGQQRITSLILLARALYDSTDDQNIKFAIQANFFRHTVPNPKYPFKLQPTEYDVDIFKKLLSGENLDEQEKSSRLYESYAFFKNKISKSEFSVEQLHAALYSLEFVRMIIDSENPQQIFESLNSTGKGLTETELIRNFLLMNLEYDAQENLYKNYWLKMEQLLQNSDTVEKFMLYYLIYKRRSNKDMRNGKNIRTTTNALYETFKKYFAKTYGEDDKAQHVEEFLQDLLYYAKFYRRLLFTAADNFEQLSALDKKFYELIYLLGATTAPIILMYLNERYTRGDFDAKTFMAIVDVLISNKCRAKVCKITGFDDEQTNANIAYRLDANEKITAEDFWKMITNSKGNNAFPSDEDFRQALMSPELNLSLKNFCKYLLYSFERNFNHSYNFAGYDDLSVELVVPKKLSAAWKKYLQEKGDTQAEFWIYALGNLALVSDTNRNAAAFSDKKNLYAESKFYYTRDLHRFSDWTSRSIRRRTEFFAKFALSIWILPEKYQPVALANENTFTLDNDLNIFTGKKPSRISISGGERDVKSWRNFVHEIMRTLYELDKTTFIQAVSKDNVPRAHRLFSRNRNDLFQSLEIADGYYIESKFDTKNFLKIVKTIVENFDELSGTNFKDEIWFTLREESSQND